LANRKDRELTGVRAERAILVKLVLPGEGDASDELAELAALADTAGAQVVGRLIQRRAKIDPQCYIGKGKVGELRRMAEALPADVIIFDNDLTPAQIRNLEKATDRKVIDRSELILDIFATHARTHQARLQVELAQLQYTYPRLTRMWTHLERIAGAAGGTGAGTVGGIGTRGPGEKQLEVDRRLVRKRIDLLKRQLKQIDRRKLGEVAGREDQFKICLVGYTNAGKSTLMNALTDAGVYVEDKLFATLDTRTRRWQLGEGIYALLSDTVGFIRNLPHHLVASFRATLEEAINADLLIHVADAADPRAELQIETVTAVLDELGCSGKNIITVFNKIDLLDDLSAVQVLKRHVPLGIAVSAVRGQGLDDLTDRVRWYYLKPAVHLTLDVDCKAGKLLSFLKRHGRIHQTQINDDRSRMELTLSANWLGPMRQFAGQFNLIEASDDQAAGILNGELAPVT